MTETLTSCIALCIDTWNEEDSTRRAELIAAWTVDASSCDALPAAEAHDGLSEMVANVTGLPRLLVPPAERGPTCTTTTSASRGTWVQPDGVVFVAGSTSARWRPTGASAASPGSSVSWRPPRLPEGRFAITPGRADFPG